MTAAVLVLLVPLALGLAARANAQTVYRHSRPQTALPLQSRESKAFLPSSIWSLVPSPDRNPQQLNNDALMSVSGVSPTDVWAVGAFSVGSNSATLIEHWNGASWTLVPSPRAEPANSQLDGVAALSATNVWAVGETNGPNGFATLIERWNGTTWSVIASPTTGNFALLNAVVALSSTNVWAVGTNDRLQPLIEHWNGGTWSIVPGNETRSLGLSAVSAVNPNDIWAVGTIVGGSENVMGAEHWDGKRWKDMSPSGPFFSSLFNGVKAISSNDVWAVGNEVPNLQNDTERTLIEHWNGSVWAQVFSPNVGQYANTLEGVTALSSTDVWAVGQDEGPVGLGQFGLFEHWDGSAWHTTPGPPIIEQSSFESQLAAVTAVGPGQLWAVGTGVNKAGHQCCARTLTVQTTQGAATLRRF